MLLLPAADSELRQDCAATTNANTAMLPLPPLPLRCNCCRQLSAAHKGQASLKFEKDGSLAEYECASGAPKSIADKKVRKSRKIGARWGVKIGKTHPALCQRFQRGNKYHFFRCGAILQLTPPSVILFMSQ
jgi:hypothetical protein